MEFYQILGLAATLVIVTPWEPLLAWAAYRLWKSISESIESSAEISLSDYSGE